MDRLASLPPEILPTIFGFLPVEDRKNVRLVSRSFRDVCDRADIVKREKFVFHFGFVEEDLDGSYLARYIGRCKRLRSAIEFRAVDLRLLPLTVWRTLGDRITSLALHNCMVNDEIIAKIFLHCSELVNIHLDVLAGSELFAGGELSCLDHLIRQRIERPKLRSFKIFTNCFLSIETFRKVFKIFPDIRTFGREQYLFYQSSSDSSPGSRHDHRFRHSPIELPAFVENFIYDTSEGSSWMVPFTRHPTIRFKELQVTLTVLDDQGMLHITEFLSSQTELRKLDLKIFAGWCEPYLVNTVLFHIFEKLRKLEELKFHINCGIKFSESECADFMTRMGDLKTLDLSVIESASGSPTTEHPLPSIEYGKLTHLRWNFGPYCETRLQKEILKRCRSLRSLCLRNVDDETLKLIFTDLTGLKELSLDCSGCQDISCVEEYPFDGLRNLEYLDLRNVPDQLYESNIFFWRQHIRTSSVVALVSKLNCPRLKVFLCEEMKRCEVVQFLSKKDTIKVLRTLAQKTPQLETLRLSSILPIEEYHVHCADFKKLRYIVRTNLYIDDLRMTDAYLKLFEACPSLMYVVNDQGRESNAHFYHRTTGSLRSRYDTSPELLCENLNIPAYKFK